MKRKISEKEQLVGNTISLRLVNLKDCTLEYVKWLNDPAVNYFLETRWSKQNICSIRQFVTSCLNDSYTYLFAIIARPNNRHVGNIKLGPIQVKHKNAQVSYFIGDKEVWGCGYATEALKLCSWFAFDILKLYRLEASIYGSHHASRHLLEKSGFTLEACFKKRLILNDTRDDHLYYVYYQDDWCMQSSADNIIHWSGT